MLTKTNVLSKIETYYYIEEETVFSIYGFRYYDGALYIEQILTY